MSNPGQIPFLRITLPFAVGIRLYDAFSFTLPHWWVGVLVLILLMLLSLIVWRVVPAPHYRLRWLTGLLVVLLMVMAGFYRFQVHDQLCAAGHRWVDQVEEGEVASVLVLDEAPQRKARSYGAGCKVTGVKQSDGVHVFRKGIPMVVYFQLDTAVASLQAGDTLIVYGSYRAVSPPQNPEAFDFGRYLRRRGVRHTVWVCSDCWILSGSGDHSGLLHQMARVRESIVQTIHESDLSPANKGLALALLIGVKENLDPETSKMFASAGAVHVLCVSGLHVGIIYMMVSLLLGPVRRIPGVGKVMFVVMGTSAIWSYAMVTGMPPSVNRASVMFTFMLVGNLQRRNRVPVNSVLASAFLLMLNNPSVLFHAGFQLSYLAVLGIITLLPTLTSLWVPRYKILLRMRDLVAVSLAAQLFTFPVAVALFNIFPNYFLLTNLLVIPITGTVMYTGVAFLLLDIHWIKPITTVAFDSLLSLMQGMVGFVDALPGSVSENITLGNGQNWLLLVAVVTATLALRGEGRKYALVALAALMACSLMSLKGNFQRTALQEVVFYQVRNGSVADFVAGGTLFSVHASRVVEGRDLEFATRGYRLWAGSTPDAPQDATMLVTDSMIVRVDHPAGAVLFCNQLPETQPGQYYCRVGVIGPNLKTDTTLFQRVKAETWLIDGRMPQWKAAQWLKIAEEQNVDVWCTRTHGSFRMK